MMLVIPVLLYIAMKLIDEKGVTLLVAGIYGLAGLPLPAFGPPGFLPKIGALFFMAVVFETVYWVMPGSDRTRAVVSTAIFGGCASGSMLFMFRFFNITGGSALMELGIIIIPLSGLYSALGGLIGYHIFEKLKNREAVKRFKSR
jgi:hypothetical protein